MEDPRKKVTNTPDEVADLISDIIKDKIVLDIGCGEGDFMQAMSKYAKDVLGIEEIEERAKIAQNKGLKVRHTTSYFDEFPQVDVYYCWTRDVIGNYLKAKDEGKHGIFILGKSTRPAFKEFIKRIDTEWRKLDGDPFWGVYITKL